ncbi:MAG: serine hydrolase [Deltaproteobacteria bacterium]|jgi:D-alanyl-D-alanine carboxypeptidase
MTRHLCLLAIAATACGAPLDVDTHSAHVGGYRDQVLTQDDGGGTVEAYDRFGDTLASADFDLDGFDDLVVAAPQEDYGGTDTGHVMVFYGGPTGPGSGGVQWLDPTHFGMLREAYDRFGASAVVGEFGCDNFPDLAIGAPGRTVGGQVGAGRVFVFHGSSSGLEGASSHSQASVSGMSPETNDGFGHALAAGNFNGAGCDDLAVGAPNEGVSGVFGAGAVAVFYGASGGLYSASTEYFTQSSVPGHTNESGDHFGVALAAGNINGSPFDDLIVGVPDQNFGSATDAGMVVAFHGSAAGLLPAQTEVFTMLSVPSQTRDADDRFGSVLAIGDFNANGFDDLAIGVPSKDSSGQSNSGMIAIFRGASQGLLPANVEWLTQNSGDASNEAGDEFGRALAVGDFDDDGFDDLAVGAPGEDIEGRTDNGATFVFFGSNASLSPPRAYYLTQRVFGGVEEDGDGFGDALVAGDFDNDGKDNLAIGAPSESVDGKNAAGAVFAGDIEPALPSLTADAAIVMNRATGRIIGAKNPDKRVPMASTTKIMTALLVYEAVNRGEVTLSSTARVRAAEVDPAIVGTTSVVGFRSGDVVTLGNLLIGLMLPSGNDAAIVLARRVAGSEAAFVARMNARARQLGLDDTSFTSPHGRDPEDFIAGCNGFQPDVTACAHYSTARDMARLADFALNADWRLRNLVATPEARMRWSRGTSTTVFRTFCNSNRHLRGTGLQTCNQSSNFMASAYGVKTGTTDLAGACLVAAANDGSADVISVVLGSTSAQRYADSTTVLNYGLANAP